MSKIKFLDRDGSWTREACFKLNLPKEMPTISRLEELIDRGFFIKRRHLYSSLSHQRVKAIVLPKELYDLYMIEYFDSKRVAAEISLTGYSWFKGYPIMYE